jgi:colicin import membrane protein
MKKPNAAKRRLLIGLAGFIFIILMGLVIRASYHNTSRYYLRSAAGAVEIWQGTFSPAGKKRILIMPGAPMPVQKKDRYEKKDIYPLAFRFFVSKADALMEVPGPPDFVGIKSYLNRAMAFATTDELRNSARVRIHQIDRMILFYKADVAAIKGTRTGLETALDYLDQAAQLNPDEIETELIKKKKATIQELLKSFKDTAIK